MADQKKYSLRPYSRAVGDSILDGAFRVFMSTEDMLSEDLKQGDFISIKSEAAGISGIGIVWRATDNIGSGHKSQRSPVIRVSEFLRSHYSFQLQDKFYIAKWTGELQQIESMEVVAVTADGDARQKSNLGHEDTYFWAQHSLCLLEGIAVGGTYDITPLQNGRKIKRQRFVVEKIEPEGKEKDLMVPYLFHRTSKILFRDTTSSTDLPRNLNYESLDFNFEGIVGHEAALEKLTVGLQTSDCGPILILGASGTGKSSILDRIKGASWGKVVEIDHSCASGSKAKSNLSQLFAEAAANQPALVLIDDIDILAPKSEDYSFIASLCNQIQKSARYRTRIIATAKRRVDIHQQLNYYFLLTVNLRIPTAKDRQGIISQLVDTKYYIDPQVLDGLIDRTHAFIASDLKSFWTEADISARIRQKRSTPKDSTYENSLSQTSFNDSLPITADNQLQITEEDIDNALSIVHASAMNEIYIDIPKLSWTDIGGSEKLKQSLQQTAVLTTGKHELSEHLHAQPVRGILLFGPPGCSKTLVARAFAAESRFNFLAVKGPELISKYVGDTEHNIREVFRKAVAAAPSVIFFDEFDSMAKRETGHDSLSPVTALLTEMDGFEKIKGVTVLAATNQPWSIDDALLRPGRFDKIFYVGPPNVEAREQILKIKTRERPLDASVDLQTWARRTDGWSGAEVTELCEVGVRKALEYFESRATSLELVKILPEHFEAAFTEINPGISEEMLRKFEEWSLSRSVKRADY